MWHCKINESEQYECASTPLISLSDRLRGIESDVSKVLFFVSGLVVACAIALWHAIPHYEYEKLNFPEMSFSRWPEVINSIHSIK
jgi:hypothetical protein